jgi:hypothetical protein
MLRSCSDLDCISILIIKASLPRRFIFNRVLAPEGELLSFASPRQLLLRYSTSCIRAVEKKVTKEKATRLPLASCAPCFCRTPNGLFSTKVPVLGAAYGQKTSVRNISD